MVLFSKAEVVSGSDQLRISLKPESQLITNQFALPGSTGLHGNPFQGNRRPQLKFSCKGILRMIMAIKGPEFLMKIFVKEAGVTGSFGGEKKFILPAVHFHCEVKRRKCFESHLVGKLRLRQLFNFFKQKRDLRNTVA